MRVCLPAIAALLAGLLAGSPAEACGAIDDPCPAGGGSYHAHAPNGWDGASPLPTVIFFHGYAATGTTMMKNKGLVKAFSDLGVLFIAPNGLRKTWAHVGSPSSARDELVFTDAILADVKRRWPVDEKLLWVSGFSQGGSMAWDLACYRGDQYAAFAPISGAFWRPLPERCPSGPINLRHIHGLGDTVVPMKGRPIRRIFRQGDVRRGMAVRRRQNGCPESPSRVERQGILTCEVWDQCSGGKELRLCLHDGGHSMPRGWVAEAYDWVQRVSR